MFLQKRKEGTFPNSNYDLSIIFMLKFYKKGKFQFNLTCEMQKNPKLNTYQAESGNV